MIVGRFEISGMLIAIICSAVATFSFLYIAESNWSKYLFMLIYIPFSLSYRPKKIREKGQEKIDR